jgi:hypothetical protein
VEDAAGSVAARVSIQRGLICIRLLNEDGAVARDVVTHLASVKPAKLATAARSSVKPTLSRASDMMAAATGPTPADVGSRYVSVTECAEVSSLPRSVILGWIDSKLVRSLKVGKGNTKRTVDLNDKDTVSDADAEMERVHDFFFAHMQQLYPALAASTLYRCAEVGQQANLNRPGFLRLMALILARDIDVLLVTDAEQLCEPGCMPLLAWILERNHVTLHIEALPPVLEHEAGLQPGLLIPIQ